jgi:hypothetical protein
VSGSGGLVRGAVVVVALFTFDKMAALSNCPDFFYIGPMRLSKKR